MNEIFKVIFGDYTFIQLFGFTWFFIIGYIIYGLSETTGRDVKSVNTPKKWSWKFWYNDNWRRYIMSVLCTYVLFRFYVEFVGHSFSEFEALLMGIIGDGIGATAKKRIDIISANRKKLMEEYNADELKSDQKVVADELKSDEKAVADELKSDQKAIANELKSDEKAIANELKSDQKAVSDDDKG